MAKRPYAWSTGFTLIVFVIALTVFLETLHAQSTPLSTWTMKKQDYRAVPPDVGVTSKLPTGADVAVLFDYAGRYSRSWWMADGSHSPLYHWGIDFVRRHTRTAGSFVVAASHGIISAVLDSKCAGRGVFILTTKKHKGNAFRLGYWHLDKVYVSRGDRVAPGDIIGNIHAGNIKQFPCIGNVAHVHFDLFQAGTVGFLDERLNPHRYFSKERGVAKCFDPSARYDGEEPVLLLPLPCNVNDRLNRSHLENMTGKIEARVARAAEMSVSSLKVFQRLLKRKGYYRGTLDGKFGPGTERAIRTCIERGSC